MSNHELHLVGRGCLNHGITLLQAERHRFFYEDMLAKPEKTFSRLVNHLLLDATSDQIQEAIERSSFNKMKEQEEKEGFREKPKEAKQFFREGRAGQWKQILTPAQIKKIVKDHGEQMKRFGYLTNDGAPV